jgi:hypothetical protein
MRGSLTIGRGVRGTAAVLILGALVAAPAEAAIQKKDVPTSMHGAVETQAITVGNGALSLLVDPGTAYAYSTLDYDDYGEDSQSFTMTARGANLNLGTIAYAVIWAPPNCATNNAPCFLSGSKDPHMPNTGLHEAKGFPAYAEALYPPPPASDAESQERVYKCIVTKDGPGSPPTGGAAQRFCKDNPEVPLTAWAETIDTEYRATGFSRAAGFDVGALAVRGSESASEVRAVGEKKVRSYGYSNVSGISLLGGYVRIDNVYSEATIVSSDLGADAKKSSASCTFSGLTVAGEMHGTTAGELADPRLKSALDQVAARTNVKVEIIAPTQLAVEQIDEGKFVTGCSGLQIKMTDLNQQSPVPCSPTPPPGGAPNCLPAPGNREELSFGRISVQQSVNEFESFSDGEDDGGLLGGGGLGGSDELADTGGGDFGAVAAGGDGVADFGAGGGSGGSASAAAGGESASAGAGSGSSTRRRAAARSSSAELGDEVVETSNARMVGAMTAAGGAGLLAGVLVLIGVVNAMATGRRFRLPGF